MLPAPTHRSGLMLALLLSAAAACQPAEPERRVCVDADGDGYGAGCALGPDCDERDPFLNSDCSADRPDCEAQPLAQGCPCLLGAREECYDGPPESAGVGPCKAGIVRCVDTEWDRCEGQVLPGPELCNGRDDDCDGHSDEGVESPCGGCDEECRGGVWGPPSAPFRVEAPLEVDPAGTLTLEWQSYDGRTLWVPNTDEGSLSKLDTDDARELARYRTRGAYPIRVAVDHRGDVWVLDGSFGGVPYLSKFAGEESRCNDRNRDGLRTSRDPKPLALGEDECLLLELPLSAAGDDPRALAIDGAVGPDSNPAGDVWVGFAGSRSLVQLEGSSGRMLAQRELGDLRPYSSAFDRYGTLWLIDRAGILAGVDANDLTKKPRTQPVPFACYSLESFSIDALGRMLLGGFGCENVFSYDPVRDLWRTASVPDLLSPRGIASPAAGSWLAYQSGQIARLIREPQLQLSGSYSLAQIFDPFETIALSADQRGRLWAISTQGGPAGVGLATRFDPEEERVSAQVPVGRGPRGTGDLTGAASGGAYAREGIATHVFGGCGREGRQVDVADGGTRWLRLHVTSVIGPGASVEIAARHAGEQGELGGSAFIQLGKLPSASDVFDLAFADGGVVEVQLRLLSPGALGAPRIVRVGIEWDCPGPE